MVVNAKAGVSSCATKLLHTVMVLRYIPASMNFPKFFAIVFGLVFITPGLAFGQCPTVRVIGPAGLTDWGGKMIFRVEGGKADWKYVWSVSKGAAIIEGQGTPTIKVSTDSSLAGSNVEAKVELEGLPQIVLTPPRMRRRLLR